MARLARLRFAGLGHENARLDDLVVAFTDGAGHAVDSTIWLRNGGGKSSLLNLFFSLVRPGRRAFLGGKAEHGERRLEDYVQPDDHGAVVAEWELTTGDELPLDMAPERVLTGVFYEWRRTEGADEAQLRSLFFAARCVSAARELTLDGLPLFADPGAGAPRGARRTLAGFRLKWQELRDRYPDAAVMWTDQAREWTQRLDELGLDAELFKYQIRMNAHEGGADQLFTPFKRTEDYINFFLELALDPGFGDELVRNIDTYRTELRERVEQLVPERDLVQGLLERLGPLDQVRGRRATLAERAARAQSELRTLSDYVTRRLDDVRAARDAAAAQAETEVAAARTAREDAQRARTEATWLRRWLAERALERTREQERLSKEQYATAEQHRLKWEAAIPLRDARRHQREVEQAMEQLMRRRDDYRGLREELAAAAQAFCAALLARVVDCRTHEAHVQDQIATEEARRFAALERAAEARVRGATAENRAQVAAGQLAQADAELARLRREGVLAEDETPRDAAQRLAAVVIDAETREQRAAENVAACRGRMDELQSAQVVAEAARARAETAREAIARELEAAQVAAATLADGEPLRRGLQVDTVNVHTLGPEAVQRLREAAHGLTERIVVLRLEQAEDERAIVHLETTSLLPPNRSAEAALAVLRGKLPMAWTGWEYLAEASPDPRGAVAHAPAIATGIVVRDADFTVAEELLREADLELDAPVLVVPQAALSGDGSVDGIVLGPTGDAWFNRAAGRTELDRRRARGEARTTALQTLEGDRQDFEATAAQLRAFQERYPPSWFAEREQARGEAAAVAAVAVERLAAIGTDRASVRQEIEATEHRQREAQNQRHAAERARDAVMAFSDRYPDGLDPFRAQIATGRAEEAAAQQERAEAEAAAAASGPRIASLTAERTRAFADAERYQREADAVRPVAGVEVAPIAGDVDGLRERFQRVQDEYTKKVGEDALAAIIEEKERSAKEAYERFRRKLKDPLTDSDVEAALDTLADPGLVERRLEEASTDVSTAMGLMGNLAQQRARAEGVLERATEQYEAATAAIRIDPPSFPETDEVGAAAAAEAEGRAQSRQAAATRHEHAAAAARDAAQRGTEALASLDKHQAVLTTMNDQAAALLEKLVRERVVDAPVPEEESEVSERMAALRRTIAELGTALADLDGDRDRAARAVMSWFDDPRFEALKSPIAARLRPWTPEQLETEVGALKEDFGLRLKTITDQLAEAERHRAMLVTQLLHGAEEGLRLLRSLANQSKVPDHVPGLGGANFLRITTHEPEEPGEIRARLATLLDEMVTSGTIPSGLELVQLAVHRVARPIGAKVLFPDPDAPASHKPIIELGKFSGGEKLTCATLLYCTLARLRARRRGRTVQPSSVLLLDNPIGKASRAKFIELQREVAHEMGIQLVYTTGVNDYEALRMLPNLVRLENTRRDRRTGERLLEHADASSLRAARVGWSPSTAAD